jgi:hypothetical protein
VSAITLPGDIEGLLRPGCPARIDGAASAIVVTPVYDAAVVDLTRVWRDELLIEEGVKVARVSLDLSDEAGADRAARWLVERTEPHVRVRVTAPRWEGVGERRWCLDQRIHFHPKWGDEAGDPMSPSGPTFHVPALASIDPAHPQADLRALRAVCLHVANRKEQP